MKKILLLISILSLFSVGGKTSDWSTLTIINKSEMPIAVQLQGVPEVCVNSYQQVQEPFYYLPVPKGSKEIPTLKTYVIAKELYNMQLFYLEHWDPVYGFKCGSTSPNRLNSGRDLRVVVLPCREIPKHAGEPTMFKYLPFAVASTRVKYYHLRYIY